MRIRRLTPADVAGYRGLMLGAYAEEEDVFTSTVAEREPLPLDWWEQRVSDDPEAAQLVLGAFDASRLVGVAGLRFRTRPRTRHRAVLYGMYVLPEFRKQGVARALVAAALGHARSTPGLRIVQLSVTETNAVAVALYETFGFRRFGTEPLAVRYGERFAAKIHMWLDLDG